MMKQTLQKEMTKMCQSCNINHRIEQHTFFLNKFLHDAYIYIYILTRRKIVVKPLTNKSQKARWDATKTLRYELHQLVRRILSISPSVSILPVLICTLLDIVVDTFPRVVLIETNSWPSPTQVEELPEACLDFFCRDLPS